MQDQHRETRSINANPAQVSVNDEVAKEKIYQLVLPEMLALDSGALLYVNLDVATVVSTVLGSLPEILALRSVVARQLPEFDISLFDNLERYVVALNHAHTLHTTAAEPTDNILSLVAEATSIRDRFYADVTTLSLRGLLSQGSLKDYKGIIGYKNVATDLQLLSCILQKNWATISGRCGTGDSLPYRHPQCPLRFRNG